MSSAQTTPFVSEDIHDPDCVNAVKPCPVTLFPALSEDAPRRFMQQPEITFSEL